MCGTIRSQLTKSVNNDWTNWHQYLPQIVFGLRSRTSQSTGHSPFYLLYGFEPRTPCDPPAIVPLVTYESCRLFELSPLLQYRSACCSASSHSSDAPTFIVGSLVLVQRHSLKHMIRNKQLTRYIGPFKILECFPHQMFSKVNEKGKVKTYQISRLILYLDRSSRF